MKPNSENKVKPLKKLRHRSYKMKLKRILLNRPYVFKN